MATVHVIGAGVAGLSCAVRIAEAGGQLRLYEAAAQGGGRCRSFFDATIERTIDNGNHMILAANAATFAYLDAIGARDSLVGPPDAVFPFFDLGTGARWTLRPNGGRIPWWVASPGRRVPGTRIGQYLAVLRLARAGPDATVADCLDTEQPLFKRFFEPLAVAALNAAPREGSARLLWAVIAETFLRGGRAARAFVVRDGLSGSFVDPALARLRRAGAEVLFGQRLRALESSGGRARALNFGDAQVELGADDAVVLAVPPAAAVALLPGLTAPEESRAILNLHFRLKRPAVLPDGAPYLGLIGGLAQWVFVRGDVAAVTVSAADGVIERPAPELAAAAWRDVARAVLGADPGVEAPLPPYRVIKERRATFAQTPAGAARRPGARTALANLFLAGDWTDTGLPATIEGAIRSGRRAADLVEAAGERTADGPTRASMAFHDR